MKIEERLIDYIYGNPSDHEVKEVEKLIEQDGKVKELYDQFVHLKSEIKETPMVQPDQDWVNQVAQSLESRNPSDLNVGKIISLRTLYQVVAIAAAVLIVGLIAINWNQKNFIQHVDSELVALHNKMESSLDENSVSARIKAVNYSEDIKDENPQVIALLAKVLKEDPSAHVRLAASEALGKWIQYDKVREELIYALKNESDASVQISIISALSLSLDDSVQQHLDDVIKDENTLDFVKEEAEVGKFRMDNNLKIY